MDERERLRRGEKSETGGDGGAATRTPSGPGSSSSGLPPPSDAPTLVPSHRDNYDADYPTLVPDSADSPTLVPLSKMNAAPWTPPKAAGGAERGFHNPAPVLEQGVVLAQRYRILQTLGEGGMGAVYKATDLELDRLVALKVIRPELAKNPAIIDRFKQELLLSQRVTHRNVIRIYDLGEGDGVKFITMEFIEGEDLRSLIIHHKKFVPEEAVAIMEQICLALEAAHNVGVIHRDLKPQNVMRDKTGRILVMDFGLARNLEGNGMTQTGALVGTMEYMSPEQALAKELDQRSDVFSAGLILYELLTGQVPYRADSALASLIRRTQEQARPISDHDAALPAELSRIVSKCLERDRENRYQNATEFLHDLQAFNGKRTAGAITMQAVKPWGQDVSWPKIMGGAVVVVLAIAGFAFRDKLRTPAASSTSAVTNVQALAILPFHNASGDPAWNWLGPSLGDMLGTDVGQSSHLRTVSPDRLQQVLHDLKIAPETSIDSTILRRVAEFTNADIVVSGQYTKLGDQIRIDATLQDLKHGRTASLKTEAQNQQELSAAIDRLADSIRQNLSLSSDLVKELRSQSFKPTSKSVDALRDYNQGLQLSRQGNNLEALKNLQASTKEDSDFALAFSKLGEIYAALGYDSDAEQASRRAVDLSQDLPLAERYLIEASRARVIKDNAKATAAYENLVKSFPDDLDVQFALGSLYEDAGEMDKAKEHYTKVLSVDGKNVDALLAMGRVEIKSGNSQAALDPLAKAKNQSIDLNNEEQEALILQATGIAYKHLNKPAEALRNYEDSIAINRRLGQKRGVAASLDEIAQIQDSMGKTDDALKSYNEALAIRKEIGAKKEAGDTIINIASEYTDRGLYDKAIPMFKEALQIQRDAGDEAYQAICLNNIGNIYLAKGQNDDAVTYFQQALQIREKLNVPGDIAETLHNLGEVYVNLGQYDKAMSSYMRALDLNRKNGDAHGAAIQSHSLGLMFLYQGRIGPAVSALEDAATGLRQSDDHARPMADSLNDLASALARAGRGKESGVLVQESQGIAHNLKSASLDAALLITQGDVDFYQGDLKNASSFYEQAVHASANLSEAELSLTARLNAATVAVAEGRTRPAISDLKAVSQLADQRGQPYLSIEASIATAEAMIHDRDSTHARQELDRSLARSEKLGSRLQLAKVRYLMGNVLRLTGNSTETASQYRQALNILNEIKAEPGAEHIVDRFDLRQIYKDVSSASENPKS
jgi:eukaryotic-like serine/threonine-protein kinase